MRRKDIGKILAEGIGLNLSPEIMMVEFGQGWKNCAEASS
jgi:hypothetical protein